MATRRLYDLAVKTGSYQDNQGNNKNRYQNIGTLMEGDNGKFILLDPLINLAAVPREQGKDRIMVSMFDPREQNAPSSANTHSQNRANSAPADDIPF